MAAAQGSVEVILDGVSLFTLPLDGNGGANHGIGGLPAGDHTLLVKFTPSGGSQPTAQATKTFTIQPQAMVSISISPDPPQPNQDFSVQIFVSV